MNKDRVWQQIKKDKTAVYGEPMLNQFLRVAAKIEKRHWDELTPEQKRLVNAQTRLDYAESPKEAEQALKDGAELINRGLKFAAADGRLETVKWIASQSREGYYIDLETALTHSSMSGQLETVKWLVQNGAKTIDKAILHAAHHGKLPVVEFLANRGATLDGALSVAASEGHTEVCKLLVEKGARRLSTALLNAAGHGHAETCEALVDKGADNLDEALPIAAAACRANAERFSEQAFRAKLHDAIARAAAARGMQLP